MRAQTTLDFAIGVTVFFFVLVFVFTFVPGTLQPFTASAQEETAASDRVADLLVMDLLADDGRPYVLDGDCTAALASDAAAPGCDFDGRELAARLDLPDRQSINVTIRAGNSDALQCWTGERVVPASDAACVTEFAAGEPLPQSTESTVAASRIVRIGKEIVALRVRLW